MTDAGSADNRDVGTDDDWSPGAGESHLLSRGAGGPAEAVHAFIVTSTAVLMLPAETGRPAREKTRTR